MTAEVAPASRRKPKRAKEQIVEIPVTLIDTGLNNRTVFDQEELEELARDIAERGLLQVPCVRPVGKRYQLVYGERRFRACLLLGWKLLPVVLQRHRPLWRWLRDTWIQGHVRTALMIMSYPCFQDASQVVLSEGDQKIQALPS